MFGNIALNFAYNSFSQHWHSIAVRRRSLIECLPARQRHLEQEHKNTQARSLAHALTLSLLVDARALPHVLTRAIGLRRGHSLALGDSSDVSRRHTKAAELQAFSCAGIPLIRLWYVDACAGKQRCQTLEFFPCALLN